MTENEKWEWGVNKVREEYRSLSPLLKRRLNIDAAAIKSCKLALQRLAESADVVEACRECRGECCKRGKNHVTVVDLLVYFNDDMELFSPCFESDICPYLGKDGCLMGPEYRPYNCITFICEQVDGMLDPLQKEQFYVAEGELRSLYEGFELFFDNSFRYGLLRSSERGQAENPAPILRGAALEEAAG